MSISSFSNDFWKLINSIASGSYVRTPGSNADFSIFSGMSSTEISAYIANGSSNSIFSDSVSSALQNQDIFKQLDRNDNNKLDADEIQILNDLAKIKTSGASADISAYSETGLNLDNFKEVIGNNFFANEDLQNIFNTDGQVSLANIFENLDANNDNVLDNNELSANDGVISADNFLNILNNTVNALADTTTGTTPTTTPTTTTATTTAETNKTSQTEKTSSGGGGGGSTSSSSSSTPTTATTTTTTASSGTPEEQLEALKQERTQIVSDYDSKITTLQSDLDTIIEDAFKDDEANKKLKEDYDTKKADLATCEASVTAKKSDISTCKSSISALTGDIEGLKAELGGLKTDTEDADVNAKNAARIEEINAQISTKEGEKATLEQQKTTLEGELATLEADKATKQQALNQALDAMTAAKPELKEAIDAKKAELDSAKSEKETKLSEQDSKIEAKEAEVIENKKSQGESNGKTSSPVSSNAQDLYKSLGLDQKGLSLEVFSDALEGYSKLQDKGNGMLGIFDTSQRADKERYYLINLNTGELVAQSVMKTGSGNMDNVKGANRDGSHATLSGFVKIGKEYYSSSMKKNAMNVVGLEQGINDNADAKGIAFHYTKFNSTWGCFGFPPVKGDDKNHTKTYELMRKLAPTGTIIYTVPTDENEYKALSALL